MLYVYHSQLGDENFGVSCSICLKSGSSLKWVALYPIPSNLKTRHKRKGDKFGCEEPRRSPCAKADKKFCEWKEEEQHGRRVEKVSCEEVSHGARYQTQKQQRSAAETVYLQLKTWSSFFFSLCLSLSPIFSLSQTLSISLCSYFSPSLSVLQHP